MPVKKGVTKKPKTPAKKRTSKKTPAKKISKQERENIKKAVSSLSGFLNEQVPVRTEQKEESEQRPASTYHKPVFQKPKPPVAEPKKPVRAYSPSALERKKRFIVHTVVAVIMIFIASLWVINMRSKFSDAGFKLGSEEQLWETAKDDYNSLVKQPRQLQAQMDDVVEQVEQAQTEEAIKKILTENLLLATASTSTTSTPSVTTSTPEVATSTLSTTTLE